MEHHLHSFHRLTQRVFVPHIPQNVFALRIRVRWPFRRLRMRRRIQVVERHYLVTTLRQRIHQVRPDEPRSPCYQHSRHFIPLKT